ncbi:MAG: hypothetical protein D4R83_03290 [Streptomycetaceae bacterium]|nr:MAG: hypothetical protein D4R83_03290 [Streptomycetaceae bacterium]
MKTAMNLLKSTNLVTRTMAQITVVAVSATLSTSAISSSALATISATSFNSPDQSITTRSLILDAPIANGAGFDTVTAMSPGTPIVRFVNYKNSGSDSGTSLTLQVIANPATTLSTDGTNGIHITVDRCSVAWTFSTGVCSSGITTTILSSTSLLSLQSAVSLATGGGNTATGITSLASGEWFYVKYTISLPSGNNEEAQNGVLPNGTIQNLTTGLKWILKELQGS